MTTHEIKRRFRLALLGYVILAAAVTIALIVMWQSVQGYKHVQQELRDVTLTTIRLIQRGQVNDCRDRQVIRQALRHPPPPGKYGDCNAISATYQKFYDQAKAKATK